MNARTASALLCLVTACAAPAAAQAVLKQQISQYGITWTFDKKYEAGQFANGDWWVVGPVKIVKIDPPSVSGGRIKNGSQINPSPKNGRRHGYDSDTDKNIFDKSLNVALDVSAKKPLTVAPHSSLCSTISVAQSRARPQVDTAAILTVLPKKAAKGDFRPPYCGKDKSIKFNERQLDYSLLKKLKPVGKPPSLASVERKLERCWFEHIPGWEGKYIHPKQNMHYYGRNLCTDMGVGALFLHLDIPDSKKRKLLVSLVQMGIDKQGVADDGGDKNWIERGGHNQGRKWPILFAGLMLNDAKMKAVGSSNIMFQDDQQTFYITQADINRTGHPQSDLGKPMWGQWHTTRPQRDMLWGKDNYQMCCTGNSMFGQILAAHLMGAKALWKHDALFDYMDRYRRKTKGAPGWIQSWDTWTIVMWDTYRTKTSNPFKLSHKRREASAYASPVGIQKAGPQEIRLTWNVPPVTGVAGYRIFRGTSASSLKPIGKQVDEVWFTDPQVAAGKTLYYAVQAVDKAGKELAKSNPIEVKT